MFDSHMQENRYSHDFYSAHVYSAHISVEAVIRLLVVYICINTVLLLLLLLRLLTNNIHIIIMIISLFMFCDLDGAEGPGDYEPQDDALRAEPSSLAGTSFRDRQDRCAWGHGSSDNVMTW